jgi:PAS domain S-box-containing protein
MNELEQLKKIVRDQTRMIIEKNRMLAEMEYRLKNTVITGSRREQLSQMESRYDKDLIEEQASMLKSILGSVPCGLLLVNGQRKIILHNEEALEIMGLSGQNVLGRSCEAVMGETCRESCLLESAVDLGEELCCRKMAARTRDGRELSLSLKVTPIRNSQGRIVGGVEIFSPLTDSVDKTQALREQQDGIFRVFSRLMGQKDGYLVAHSHRVNDIALQMADALGMGHSNGERDLSLACLVHDVGLLTVPGEVLSAKRTRPAREHKAIRSHPASGEWILDSLEGFDHIKKIVRSHHERFDGGGYPDGLVGEEIPKESRILALAEAYDAMCHDAAAPERSPEEIIREIQENSGSQFDPEMVDVFLKEVVSKR